MSPRRILVIVTASIALVAFGVGMRAGWNLMHDYLELREARAR